MNPLPAITFQVDFDPAFNYFDGKTYPLLENIQSILPQRSTYYPTFINSANVAKNNNKTFVLHGEIAINFKKLVDAKQVPNVRTLSVSWVNEGNIPTISFMSPNSGSLGGLNYITIIGSGFTGVTSVKFGSVIAMWFRVVSDNIIHCAPFPVPFAQTVDLTVSTLSANAITKYNFIHYDPIGLSTYTQPPNFSDICLGLDGKIWLPDSVNGKVWTFSVPTATFTTYTLPPPNNAFACNLGPDGNVWVTDSSGSVWKVTTIGVGTEYLLPGSDPTDICVGPDGNMWVADINGAIWKVTISGVVTKYPLPGTTLPFSICGAPDGNVWAADFYGYVWRITPDGIITQFTIDLTNGVNCYINVGPDGNLWTVADYTNDYVYVIDMNGTVVNQIPFSSVPKVIDIISGPDGNLWAIDDGVSPAYWKITPSGTMTQYPLPSFPTGGYCGIALLQETVAFFYNNTVNVLI